MSRLSVREGRLSAFKRVVVWGHPLHSHTHSYVHEAFARAFRRLGAQTLWTNDVRALSNLDLAGTLFLSEGQVLSGLPLRKDCTYVLHNAPGSFYAEVADRVLALQVLTSEVLEHAASGSGPERINAYTYVDQRGVTPHLFQPWATDLLPDEIDVDVSVPRPWPAGRWRSRVRRLRTGLPSAVFVGTIGSGLYGNEDEIAPFRDACARAGLEFIGRTGIGRAQHVRLVRGSWVAPAIVGRWQLENAYIPCRIFKNISYGKMGVTNSPWLQEAFEEPILCRADTDELLWSSLSLMGDREAIVAQMKEVQARHTYIQRIRTLLEYLP